LRVELLVRFVFTANHAKPTQPKKLEMPHLKSSFITLYDRQHKVSSVHTADKAVTVIITVHSTHFMIISGAGNGR